MILPSLKPAIFIDSHLEPEYSCLYHRDPLTFRTPPGNQEPLPTIEDHTFDKDRVQSAYLSNHTLREIHSFPIPPRILVHDAIIPSLPSLIYTFRSRTQAP